jgi:DNA-binding NtrC family response regulator
MYKEGQNMKTKYPKRSILIVEDNEDERELAKIIFKKKKFDVRLAKSIQTTMKQLRSRKFDMILLDLRLPDGSGMEILEKIGSEYKNRIIVVTGSGDIHDAVNAMKKGAFDFFTKPINYASLLATINKAIEVAQDYKELENDHTRLYLRSEIDKHYGHLIISIEELEKMHIATILKHTNYNMKETAKLLGIGRTTLYRKIKKYKLPSI